MSSPPTTTPWVPMWGGAGGPSPIAATADCTLVAGDQDVPWPAALGAAISCIIYVKGVAGAIRRLGVPPGGSGTVVRLYGSGSNYPGFYLRQNAASGVGSPFWLWPNADQVIPIQGMVTLVWDGGYWTQVAEAPYQTEYVTAFPTAVYNGQEVILVDSLTNPTYQWRFRYNANSTSPYKWEFVGGAPLFSAVEAAENYGSSTFGDLATPGPSFIVPRTGEYDLSFYMQIGAGSINNWSYGHANVWDNGAVMNPDLAIILDVYPTAVPYVTGTGFRRGVLTAGHTIKTMYNVGYQAGGTGNIVFMKRRLTALPVRVA